MEEVDEMRPWFVDDFWPFLESFFLLWELLLLILLVPSIFALKIDKGFPSVYCRHIREKKTGKLGCHCFKIAIFCGKTLRKSFNENQKYSPYHFVCDRLNIWESRCLGWTGPHFWKIQKKLVCLWRPYMTCYSILLFSRKLFGFCGVYFQIFFYTKKMRILKKLQL